MDFDREVVKFMIGMIFVILFVGIPFGCYSESGWIGVVATYGVYIGLIITWLIGRLIWAIWEKA